MSQTYSDPNQPAVPGGEGALVPGSYWVPPPPPPPPPTRGEPHLGRWIIISFLIAAIAAGGTGIGVGWGLARALRPQTAVQSPLAIASPNTAPSNGSLDMNAIAAKVDPAIVDINTVLGTGSAAGTGMIVTANGEVLTNNHVVDGSTTINVTIAGRSGTYTAHVVGVAPAADVAVIQIEGVSGLPTVTLASSAALTVGEPVVALGNALGLGGKPNATTGKVTNLDQAITASQGNGQSEQLTGLVESDAPISPGDSGGPLVNSAGQVVGMITAGDVQGFRSQTSTVNYAIPSDTARSFVDKINAGQASADIIYGQVGFVGVEVSVSDASSGALVTKVVPSSPADSAGITPGSVITSVGGTKVSSAATLGPAIKSHKPGDRVPFAWVDQNGTPHTATVTLGGVNP